MKKGLVLIAAFILSGLSACFSQEPGKVVFKFTPDTLVEDRLNIPIDISVRIERICLTSRKKFANYPDGVKQSIADDLGTIFNNRLITGGDVSILIDVKTLKFDFRRNFVLRYFLPSIVSVEFIGIAELDVTLYESDSMNKIVSYQINHRISERVRRAQHEKYIDFYDSDENIVLQVLKEALKEIKTKIFRDREKIEAYWQTPLTEISPELFFRHSKPIEVKDTLFLQFEKQYQDHPYIIDERDGSVYGVTKIGDQFWMRQNLKWLPVVYPPDQESHTNAVFYVYGYDGKDISEAKETEHYKNYGVLYNWSAAKIACPKGWRLPDDKDWQVLQDYLIQQYPEVNSDNLGNMLKSTRQIRSNLGVEYATEEHPRWNSNRRNFGKDLFRFSAFPAGYRNFHENNFVGLGGTGAWWSSTEVSLNKASSKHIWYNSGKFYFRFYYTRSRSYNNMHLAAYKPTGLSVRCVLGRSPWGYYDNVEALNADYSETKMLYDLVNEPVIVQQKPQKELDYLVFGVGYGVSYGGLGIQTQRTFNNRIKIGVNAGLGYFPPVEPVSSSVFYSVGAKFFIAELKPYDIFIDFQIGTLARYNPNEGIMVFHLGSVYGGTPHTDNSKDFNLYGPRVSFGYEVFSPNGLGFNVSLGAGMTIMGSDRTATGFGQVLPLIIDLGIVFRRPIKTTSS